MKLCASSGMVDSIPMRFRHSTAILVLCVGCGRIGFDTRANPDGASSPGNLSGELDPSFNGTGYTSYDYVDDDGSSKDDRATDVAIDGRGRIVVSASGTYNFYQPGDEDDMATISIRLLADGGFDAEYQFGALSRPGVTVDHASLYSHGNGLILDGDDVVVCGYREWSLTDDPTFYRYLAVAGQPDPAFAGGVSNVPILGEAQGEGCAFDPTDGDYVVVGGTSGGAMHVAKMRAANGSVDTTFGSSGSVLYDVAGSERAHAVVVDSLGRIYAAGHATPGSNMDLVVWRYLPDGTLDGSFSGDGMLRYDGGGDDVAYGIALDVTENPIVVGVTNATREALVLRIDRTTGNLDPAFGVSGVWVGGGPSEAHDLAIDGDGVVWVTGGRRSMNTNRMAIWKLSPAGVLETSFGVGGVFTEAGVVGESAGFGIALDGQGRLVVAGELRLTSAVFWDVAIWRIR